MSGPVQYLSFDAFASNPVKGSVNYTNFETQAPGSGVWVPSAFSINIGATYAMTVSSFTPTSPTSVTFAGSGGTTGWNSTFTGAINGSSFMLAMTEVNAADTTESYLLNATGTIAADGSVSGTWSDNYGLSGRTGAFTIADVGYEVYHYVAQVTHVTVTKPDAWFDYTIPGTTTVLYMHVYDGGQPGAGHDTWGFSTTQGGPFGNYPIVAGNLTVFS